ncbi:MAG: carbohydrate ABC transporter permease [Lachnospiraceae bacterium]|nr:carbohydrate ABC transporter permease [Lachnospiraceae bacterium]
MKRKKKVSMFDVCNTIFMLLVLLIIVYPLYYAVIASFSEASAVASGKVIWKPIGFTLDSYKQVFSNEKIWIGYANTIYYTVCGTLFNLFLTIPTAYALSKKNLPYRNFIMTIFMITMYFGGGMVPNYLLVKNLGLLNTRTVLIILGGISVYNLIVTRTYFSTSISESLYEAADIDGAGEFQKFLSIAVPLAKPIIAVMVLYYAVGHWNSYFNALLYVSDKSLEPLQSVLRRILILNEDALNQALLTESLSADELLDAAKRSQLAYTMKYAVVFVASAPLLIAYPFVQKYFVKGVMIGAVKE